MTSPVSTLGQLEQAAQGKDRKLKRRFRDVEEETRSEALSGERSVRIQLENSNEITQESKIHQSNSNGFPVLVSTLPMVMVQPGSTTLPLNLEERNLCEAVAADGNEQPLLASSHPGPPIPRRQEDDAQRTRGDIKDGDIREDDRSHSGNSQVQDHSHQPYIHSRLSITNNDVDMNDATTSNNNSTSSAIAAADTAKPEAAAAIFRGQGLPGTTSSLDEQQVANHIAVANISRRNSSLQTKTAPSINPTFTASHSHTPSLENTPSIENIIKVAAAAVAAQATQSATAAIGVSSNLTQSHQVVDPNLDPNLPGGAPSKSLPAHDIKNSASTSSTNSSLSNNPYLGLSMLAKQGSGSTTPAMSMHPQQMYYPPNAPITPNTSTYPVYGNPYYYLAGPVVPGPNGMFLPPGAAATFPPPPARRPSADPPRTAKPKRLKAHAVTTKSFSIPMVPRDKDGKPMLPLNVGIMTVINLGEVCMREHFHTERYIFPVGYEVTRRYLSTINPTIEVVYHCTILDGGDGPKFQIVPSDRADKPIIAGTATGAWSNIVRQANAIRNRQHSNSVSGPDFFGLAQNTIKHLIQELPNSDRLRDYVWQNFVEGGPLGGRHAAVIPALPEEYDASMPIGAYYPKREVSANPGVPRGLSHYPQHIIAQAEAQKSQQLTQQVNGNARAGPSSSSASSQLGGGSLAQNATQGNHLQIALAPASSSKGLSIQHYQPIQQAQAPSQGPQKRASKSSAPSTSGRSTRASTRGSQRQEQQQQDPGSPPDPAISPASEAMPITFAGIMSQFSGPSLAKVPHSAGS